MKLTTPINVTLNVRPCGTSVPSHLHTFMACCLATETAEYLHHEINYHHGPIHQILSCQKPYSVISYNSQIGSRRHKGCIQFLNIFILWVSVAVLYP
jgi:hypothetical protein